MGMNRTKHLINRCLFDAKWVMSERMLYSRASAHAPMPLAFQWYGWYATNIDKVVHSEDSTGKKRDVILHRRNKKMSFRKIKCQACLDGWNSPFTEKGIAHAFVNDAKMKRNENLHRHKLKMVVARETHALNSQIEIYPKISMSLSVEC